MQTRLRDVIPEEYYDKVFYSTTPALREAQAKSKHNDIKRQQTVSVAEAAEMQRRMFAMKDFLNERGGNYEHKSALRH